MPLDAYDAVIIISLFARTMSGVAGTEGEGFEDRKLRWNQIKAKVTSSVPSHETITSAVERPIVRVILLVIKGR